MRFYATPHSRARRRELTRLTDSELADITEAESLRLEVSHYSLFVDYDRQSLRRSLYIGALLTRITADAVDIHKAERERLDAYFAALRSGVDEGELQQLTRETERLYPDRHPCWQVAPRPAFIWQIDYNRRAHTWMDAGAGKLHCPHCLCTMDAPEGAHLDG